MAAFRAPSLPRWRPDAACESKAPLLPALVDAPNRVRSASEHEGVGSPASRPASFFEILRTLGRPSAVRRDDSARTAHLLAQAGGPSRDKRREATHLGGWIWRSQCPWRPLRGQGRGRQPASMAIGGDEAAATGRGGRRKWPGVGVRSPGATSCPPLRLIHQSLPLLYTALGLGRTTRSQRVSRGF